jgi:hypothetical protein
LQSRWGARAHCTGSSNARAAIGSTLLRSLSPRIPALYVAKAMFTNPSIRAGLNEA